MRKMVTLTMVWLVMSSVFAAELPIVNGDFELPAIRGKIPGWSLSQHAGGTAYEMGVVPSDQAGGKQNFQMHRLSPQVYGLISQDVPVQWRPDQYLELSALMKGREVGEQGWLLVMNFMGGGSSRLPSGIIKQLRSEPLVGSSDWARMAVRAPIPEGTRFVSIGAMLLDDGTGWVDDFRLQLLDAP